MALCEETDPATGAERDIAGDLTAAYRNQILKRDGLPEWKFKPNGAWWPQKEVQTKYTTGEDLSQNYFTYRDTMRLDYRLRDIVKASVPEDLLSQESVILWDNGTGIAWFDTENQMPGSGFVLGSVPGVLIDREGSFDPVHGCLTMLVSLQAFDVGSERKRSSTGVPINMKLVEYGGGSDL